MFEDHIRRFNAQLTPQGLESENLENLADDYGAVVIAGMGGSALPGEIIRGFAKELGLRVPVLLWKDYGFPEPLEWAKKPLIIAVSFSGETKETLSVYREAGKRGVARAVVSGRAESTLYRQAAEENIPRVHFGNRPELAEGLTPRTACGILHYSVLTLLSAAFGIPVKPYSQIDTASYEAGGRGLAEKLEGKTPLIYTAYPFHALGPIWKIIFNETAKIPAFSSPLRECAHGEIAGFEKMSEPFHALFVTEGNGEEKFQHVLGEYMPVERITLEGGDPFEKLWRNVALAQWTGLYMAKQGGVNPEVSSLIEGLKK